MTNLVMIPTRYSTGKFDDELSRTVPRKAHVTKFMMDG